MTEITTFDMETGAITGVGVVSADTLQGYFDTGRAGVLLDVQADARTHYLQLDAEFGPALAEYTEAERDELAALKPGWVWQMPERIAVDARDLAATRESAYAKCFTDINAVVWDAVGNMTEEYKDALVEARAYVAAGYTGTVPGMVACYADKESQTGAWAADDIIARADAFQAAKVAMRTHRMGRQKEMQAATTLAELDAAVAAWDGFIALLRAQLGLTGAQ